MAFGQSIDQRKQNKRNHLVELFRLTGELSKAQARQRSGYSMDTLISLFKTLEEDGYIVPAGRESVAEETADAGGKEGRGKGRPAELYRLNGEAETYVGATFNQNGIWTTLVGFDGRTLDTLYEELPELRGQEELERRFERHLEAFALRNARLLPTIKRIGLALPGRIDTRRGIMVRYNLMPFLKDLDLKPFVERRIPGRPITVQHNITGLVSILLTDKDLISKHARILYVSARSGAAHALIQDGKIILDDGEMGHLTVKSSDRPCRCGRVGCLDTVFSAAEFHRLCPHTSWSQLSRILADPSPAAEALRAVVEPPFVALAEALMNLTAAFSPDAVVLSGELFSILPDPARWIADRIGSACAGAPPSWIPAEILYREHGAESAAAGVCLTMIEQDWPWSLEQPTA